jgi:ribonuclease Z
MRFTFLGTSGAVPSAERDNTSLAFVSDGVAVVVDCSGSPIQKLRRAGVDPFQVTHVVCTHLHVDHAYGLPSLVQGLRLLGRADPLAVVTRPEHVEPLAALLEVFRVRARPGMFRLDLVPISLEAGAVAPEHHGDLEALADEARTRFRGEVVIAPELGTYEV